MELRYPQLFFKCAGGNSCYADCIVRLSAAINGRPLGIADVASAYELGIGRGYVRFNFNDYRDPGNFTVDRPDLLLGALTGRRFSVRRESRGYRCGPGEYEVLFYALSEQDGARGRGHFCLPGYDPLMDSNTARNGLVYSKRVFREEA